MEILKKALKIALLVALFASSYVVLFFLFLGIYGLVGEFVDFPDIQGAWPDYLLLAIIAVICGIIVFKLKKQLRKQLYVIVSCLCSCALLWLFLLIDRWCDFKAMNFLSVLLRGEPMHREDPFGFTVILGFVFPLITLLVSAVAWLCFSTSRAEISTTSTTSL